MNFFAPVIAFPALTCAVLLTASNLYMDQPFKLDFLWAGLCMPAAVHFIFRP
jgi:uncharacterized protein (DUF486 family)